MDLNAQTITWYRDGGKQTLKLRPGHIYMQPNGYRVEMQKHPGAPSWRLLGTEPEGTFCHKPCTVSGGGKSEISKSIDDAVIYGSLYVGDLEEDLDIVEAIFERDYNDRLKPEFAHEDRDPSRKPLSPERSLGSVIKLLTPSPANTDAYNAWLETIPDHIRALAFIIKRVYRPEWGERWRERLSVDVVNGSPGHELKMNGRKLVGSYLRVGLEGSSAWRVFKVRQDFIAAEKVQMEDDISASVVVPTEALCNCSPNAAGHPSVKLVSNCEFRLFQRPDEAIHPGFDRQTEADMATSSPTSNPCTARRWRTSWRTWWASRPSPRPCRTCCAAPTAPAPATWSPPPTRGWWTASRARTPATCSCARISPTRCAATWRRWGSACTGASHSSGPSATR
jgi:hypothetical protein